MAMSPEDKLVERDREMVPKVLVRAMFVLCMSVHRDLCQVDGSPARGNASIR